MSKNTLLSELINYISANASGNVVIAAPSSGYALDVTGTGRFTSQLTLSTTLSINGGSLTGNNIVSMRCNSTGGQFRIEKSDGSLSAYPFYVGVDGTALAYYYNTAGALKVLLHTDGTSYFGNNLSVGYSSYSATSYALDVNGTSNIVGASRFLSTITLTGGNEQRFYRADNAIYTRLYDAGSTFTLDNRNGNGFSFQSVGSNQFIINSDGAMGFNYPILGSRSFMFRAVSGRVLVIEAAEAGGVHSIYLRPNASGRHLISSNYLSGGVYLPLALSGRENDSDLVLATNGNIGVGVTSPSHKLQVSGNIYSTDTVFARNLKPEAFASVTAGTPTSAGIPLGYSTLNITTLTDNNWRAIMNNINDVKGYFWVTLGDAASKDTAHYFMAMTSPAYGVRNFGVINYQDNGWNTGGFEFTYDDSGGTHRLLLRCSSYYSGSGTAYGTIYFLRLE